MSDDIALWWTDWYEIVLNDRDTSGFGDRMAFASHILPMPSSYEYGQIYFLFTIRILFIRPFCF